MNYLFSLLVILSIVGLMFKKFRKKSIVGILLVFLALLTKYPKLSIDAASEGINLWLLIVMPSLFPFFIINDILISLRVPDNISKLLKPVAKLLFNTSGFGAYVFIMSIFSGYPSGAKITSELVQEKYISSKEGQKILSFASTSGPLFIIGAVGTGMLKSQTAGNILFFCHILGAILNGVLFRFININTNTNKYTQNYSKSLMRQLSPKNALSSAIGNSLITSGYIGAYIILFSVIISLLEGIRFFEFISNVLSLCLTPKITSQICLLLKASLEISNGCKIIANIPISFEIKMILSSFIIAFSGLSIIGQVQSLINSTGINLKIYVISKLSHGVISALLCFIILNINNITSTSTKLSQIDYLSIGIFSILSLLTLIMLLNTVSILTTGERKI